MAVKTESKKEKKCTLMLYDRFVYSLIMSVTLNVLMH